MTKVDQSTHNSLIVEQFTKQAIPFTEKPEHSNENEFQLMFALTEVSSSDKVLDLACGSGFVSCAFAKIAHHVTGIDVTPAMIERARLLQQEKQLNNLFWQIGNVLPLLYEDATFSLVITRYSFHHFIDPQAVLAQMCRVCMPGGKVAVVDVTPAPGKVTAYNYMEKLRDPSHTKALTFAELQEMFHQAGLINIKTGSYQVEMQLEKQLEASFPNHGDANKIRQLFIEDLTTDSLGVGSYRRETEISFAYKELTGG